MDSSGQIVFKSAERNSGLGGAQPGGFEVPLDGSAPCGKGDKETDVGERICEAWGREGTKAQRARSEASDVFSATKYQSREAALYGGTRKVQSCKCVEELRG